MRLPRPLFVLLLATSIGCIQGATDDDDTATDDDDVAADDDDDGPDYDHVFNTAVVQRIDLTFTSADWEAMQADLAEVMEEDDGGDSGGPPDEAFDACESSEVGDACSYVYEGEVIEGVCRRSVQDETVLMCVEQDDDEDSDPSYVPVTVQYDEDTWEWVGIRYKGNSSLKHSYQAGVTKLPFRLEMDEYEDDHPETDDQRFHGFKELTFGPGYFDSSYLHNALALEVLDGMGVPAPRWGFYEVYADLGDGESVYWGLYTMIEDPSDDMLGRVYADDSGNLYKPEGTCAKWGCFDEANFEKKTNDDEADFSDVEAAIEALLADGTDAAAWRSDFEEVFDVDGFLQWLATNTALGNWDAYGMAPHNYYLYADPSEGGRLTWIPWDHNMALAEYQRGLLSVSLSEVGSDWPLIERLIADPTYDAVYRGYLAEALTGTYELATFAARAQDLHDLIAPYVEAEEAPYTQMSSMADFEASVGDLEEHVADRHALIEAEL